MSKFKPLHTTPVSGGIPPLLSTHPVTTPLRADTWAQALLSHSDRLGVDSLIQGIHGGFRIGLQLQPSCRYSHNMPSGSQQEAMVDDFFAATMHSGVHAWAIFHSRVLRDCHHYMGVIPKKTPGKWLVIVDLSRPKGASINDNTRRQHCHLAYSSVYDATLLMQALGPEACMAKVDIRDAYFWEFHGATGCLWIVNSRSGWYLPLPYSLQLQRLLSGF